MKFCRINLSKTNYASVNNYKSIRASYDLIPQLKKIYAQYCRHKRFESVMPIFEQQWIQCHELLGYYHNDNLVAFSMLNKLDDKNIESSQFAWDYVNPELQLGIRSLQNECAVYKALGYEYLYLGNPAPYKTKFDGYEELRNPYV